MTWTSSTSWDPAFDLAYNQQYNGISAMGLMGFGETHRRLVHHAYAEPPAMRTRRAECR